MTEKKDIQQGIFSRAHVRLLIMNLLLTLGINLFLEYTERHSFEEVFRFINDRTFVFLFNGLIIFASLSIVFLVRHRIFAYVMIITGWLLIGAANAAVLAHRKTPFTAVDLTIVKSILPILRSYLAAWQVLGVILLLSMLVAGAVALFLYAPVSPYCDRKSGFVLTAVICACLGAATYIGVGKGQLINRFDNLIAGYRDYGVAYGFAVTAIDTGIDRPIDYSRDKVERLLKKVEKKEKKLTASDKKKYSRKPNIIFLQLESFFDPTIVEGLTISEDPIPNFRRMAHEYTAGYLRVPVYGAGTINTEFEVITGMSLDHFGTGEYPYRSILHKKTCDSVAYWLKNEGYEASVIHNNNASFYDRDTVFSNLGFDNFITIENMDAKEFNEVGWAKDKVLTKYILDTMERTEKKDLIYSISVQGHGDYPSVDNPAYPIKVSSDRIEETYVNQFAYYVNQIREMDDFLGELTDSLETYPEEVILVIYGDHLPGINLETKDLETGSKYDTPYIIWDNYGDNKARRKKESEPVKAWQLAAKVLKQVNIHDGILNIFHQTMRGSEKYKKRLKLLSYDMLYGSGYCFEDGERPQPTTLCFSLNPPSIRGVIYNGDHYYLIGERFNEYSRVFVNGLEVHAKLTGQRSLELTSAKLKDEDVLVIHQVSKTNHKITLNEAEPYIYYKENLKILEPLYEEEESMPEPDEPGSTVEESSTAPTGQ